MGREGRGGEKKGGKGKRREGELCGEGEIRAGQEREGDGRGRRGWEGRRKVGRARDHRGFVASSHFRGSGEGALLPPAAAAPEQSSITTPHLPPPKIKLRKFLPKPGLGCWSCGHGHHRRGCLLLCSTHPTPVSEHTHMQCPHDTCVTLRMPYQPTMADTPPASPRWTHTLTTYHGLTHVHMHAACLHADTHRRRQTDTNVHVCPEPRAR